jgi:hypothetical protein
LLRRSKISASSAGVISPCAPRDFGAANGLHLLAQFRYQRPQRLLPRPGLEEIELPIDERLHARHLGLAAVAVRRDVLLERGQVDARQPCDVFARHGLWRAEIDQYREAAAAARQRATQVACLHERLRRGDGADDRVGPHQFLWQAVETRGRRAHVRGHRFRTRARAVRHDELSDAERTQVPRHLRTGLTCANHDHARSRQRQGLRQLLHRGGRHREGAHADARLGAHEPPGAERGLHHAGQQGPRATAGIERGPNLTKDLGLADDQGFEARADPEQMPRRGAGRQGLDAVIGIVHWHAHGLGESGRHDAHVLGRPFAPVHLCSIARGEHERLDAGAGQLVVQRHGRVAGQAPLLQGTGPDGAVIQRQRVQPAKRPRRAGRAGPRAAGAGGGNVGLEAAGTIGHGKGWEQRT